jgi:integrase
MRLTDLLIKSLKVPTRGQKTHFDDTMKGFGVRISMGGTKSFVVMYGKRRKLKTIGHYPGLTLADARKEAKKALGVAVDEKEGLAGRLASLTFSEARNRFLEDTESRTKASTYEQYRRPLQKHFNFTKPVGEITRHDVMDALGVLKGRTSETRHAFVSIRTMMSWCVLHGFIVTSPVPPLQFKTESRTRILTDEELKAVWKKAQNEGFPYGTIVQLLILTGQRRGEIAGLRRSWITHDAITFPVGFCKNKREHKIPIGTLTKQVIDSIPDNGDMLFPARGKPDQPYNGWSKSKREFDERLDLARYTLHDLRRTYSSNLAKLGVPIHVTERLLNHLSGTISGVAAVYNRHSYWDEMKEVTKLYEGHVTKLTALAN